MVILNLYEYLIYSIISFVIIYLTGNFTLRFLNINTRISSFNFFLKLLFGIIVTVTMYSLFQSFILILA